ncbi:hypothetical protein ABH920_005218 [Catenulispora sp. EB89]|uniref:hypothetical protein n=1 Tax=Catenulispora sp. EB89 TaxID=3156257 RepID=UPI0035135CC2
MISVPNAMTCDFGEELHLRHWKDPPEVIRNRLSGRRVRRTLAIRPNVVPSAAPAKFDLRQRMKAVGYKICVLGLAALAAAYRSTQLKGTWHTGTVGMSCTFFAGVVAVISDHPHLLVHPVQWLRRWRLRVIPGGSPQHSNFPTSQFLVSLRKAREVVIVDTLVFFLADPGYRQEFLSALSEALDRGAKVSITVLCPCSRALATRARQLDADLRVMREQAEAALVELELLRLGLDAAAGNGVLDVWLTTFLPVQSHYRCDDAILMSILALGSPSQDGPQFQYSIDSPHGRLEADTLAGLRSKGAALKDHMRGELSISVGGRPAKLIQRRYVLDEKTVYLALTEANDVALASAFLSGTWRHGSERARQVKRLEFIDPANDKHLHYTLQRRTEDKYRDGAIPVFFRVIL